MSGSEKSGSKKLPKAFDPSREDEHLVRRCRNGERDAWEQLIDKYKNLIYSIPIKYGFSRQDANEIFQAVCLSLLSEIPTLRKPRALAAWLITTTSRRCFRFRKERSRIVDIDVADLQLPADEAELPERLAEQLAQEKLVRDAVNDLGSVCRQLIDLFFYRDPPLAYDEAARLLGMAKGSLGATRMRCLDKLRSRLEQRGFR